MDTNSNGYTLIYATVMVVIVALMLAFVSGALKDKQNANVEIDKKKQILTSLRIDTKGKNIEQLYEKYIVNGLVINTKGEILSKSKEEAFKIDISKELSKNMEARRLPIFVAQIDGKTKYVLSLRGTGLWGPIWGYVSLNDDRNTIYGAYFSHASETPGLGANIADPPFQKQFEGKHILNDRNEFVSLAVMKSGKKAEGKEQVDAISGGTITSKGVEAMLQNCLGQYEKFLQQSITGGTKE
ncbi:MAG: NADH:ubiquinone reductase (Na(+)-transporting) subunit C [Paludibacteraceae bacterium]|jgi:Na+-transporting NADH:ubiquinone oxidoreductase subunit C|nr:NADH:ubiquinone reductase (Na(+)-transporting) subunit C [Paludibacteraceae bacterium]